VSIDQDLKTVHRALDDSNYPWVDARDALSRIDDEDKMLRLALMEARDERDVFKEQDADWRAQFALQAFTSPDADWGTIYDSYKARHEDALAQRDALKAALEKNAVMLDHAQVIMRKHGFKFETPLHLSEGFEKLAFTFYSMLCEVDSIARQALEEVGK